MEASWFIVLVFTCLSILIITSIRSLKSIQLPPGPIHFPFISDILWLRKSFPQLEPILRNLHAKHGPIISFHFWSTPNISISDRFLAHKALVQNGAIFAGRPKALFLNKPLNIASSCYGPTWRVLRNNLATTMLHSSRFNSFSNTRKCVLEALVKQLKSETESNHSIKFIDHIHHAIFSLLVFMCFGEKVDNEKIETIKHIQRLWIISSGKFGVLNFFPKMISHMIFQKRWNEFLQLQKDQKDVFIELIRAREKECNRNHLDHERAICYVDTLLNLELPEEKRKLDDDELVALCSEFLTAGTDTTSTALEWVMANLIKYKHVQQRLVEEIGVVVGDREEREVKEEDLEKLPYLKAVILEGLRRHPPSHYLIPHAVTEDVIFNGYFVPKNGTVNFMVAEVGWDPTVWEDPMAFKPERFEESSNGFDVTGQNEIKMMPFGAGRRICPAYNLAMLHVEYFVANLIWNFEWKTSLPGSNVDLSEKQEFTMVMKYPLEAQISPRI